MSRMAIHGDYEVLYTCTELWQTILSLAVSNGWTPQGSVGPRGCAPADWDGRYAPSSDHIDSPFVESDDAASLKAALERALDASSADPSAKELILDQGLKGLVQDDDSGQLWLLENEDVLKAAIAVCGSPFLILDYETDVLDDPEKLCWMRRAA